jgi:hypothetical protein
MALHARHDQRGHASGARLLDIRPSVEERAHELASLACISSEADNVLSVVPHVAFDF